MHAAVVGRLELEADLRRGLNGASSSCTTSPSSRWPPAQLSASRRSCAGSIPSVGCCMPDAFIPLAEETGLIHELGRQVLVTACAQTRRWQRRASRPAAAAASASTCRPASSTTIASSSTSRRLGDVRAAGRPASSSRSPRRAMMQDTEATIGRFHALKELGVRLAVDDFGDRATRRSATCSGSRSTSSRSTAPSSPPWTSTDSDRARWPRRSSPGPHPSPRRGGRRRRDARPRPTPSSPSAASSPRATSSPAPSPPTPSTSSSPAPAPASRACRRKSCATSGRWGTRTLDLSRVKAAL